MTEQNPKIDGRTKRALDIAIDRKQVSQASYRAVLAGRITLQEAKAIGRDGAPATDAAQHQSGPGTTTGTARSASADTNDTGRAPCLCGCGGTPKGAKSRFLMGHDSRLHSDLKRNLEKDPLLRNERFTVEQRAYAKERGLIR